MREQLFSAFLLSDDFLPADSAEAVQQFYQLLDTLEADEDVQSVVHNIDLSEGDDAQSEGDNFTL